MLFFRYRHTAIAKVLFAIAFSVISLVMVQPALAHHPFGGSTPDSLLTGFLSGLGHPIVGLDHFAFVVAVGLLAVLKHKLGFLIPIAFTGATAIGAIVHLQSIDLPIAEIIIALSVIGAGVALAVEKFNLSSLIVLSGIAGIFHGFAYGEAIFGAEMTPLSAYLFGFIVIQLSVSAIAFYLGRLTVTSINKNSSLALRFAGCVIAGIGISFLSNSLF